MNPHYQHCRENSSLRIRKEENRVNIYSKAGELLTPRDIDAWVATSERKYVTTCYHKIIELFQPVADVLTKLNLMGRNALPVSSLELN